MKTKVWFITATCLVLMGCLLFAGVMTALKWDFMKLATVNYETNTYEITEFFDSISINGDTADIIFLPAHDGKCKVVCYEKEKSKYSVTVENNTLLVKLIDKKTAYNFIEHIGLNFSTPKITVYLPNMLYASLHIDEITGNIEIPKVFDFNNVDISLSTGDVAFYASGSEMVKINTTTGDIRVEYISAGALFLSVSTGDVTAENVNCEGDFILNVSTGDAILKNVKCKNLTSKGGTGDISLSNVIAAEKFSVERTTGDIKLENSDATDIFAETDTGSVRGSILSEKLFITETKTGKIIVPETTRGGKCEIETSTGDIIIDITP